MPAPWTVLAGPLRLTCLRTDLVMRARLLLRRRRLMPAVYPADANEWVWMTGSPAASDASRSTVARIAQS